MYDMNVFVEHTAAMMEGQMDMSATLRFCTPYTFRRESTTPPLSRGFMAQVPSWCRSSQNISLFSELSAHRIP